MVCTVCDWSVWPKITNKQTSKQNLNQSYLGISWGIRDAAKLLWYDLGYHVSFSSKTCIFYDMFGVFELFWLKETVVGNHVHNWCYIAHHPQRRGVSGERKVPVCVCSVRPLPMLWPPQLHRSKGFTYPPQQASLTLLQSAQSDGLEYWNIEKRWKSLLGFCKINLHTHTYTQT